jgi:16S rRNA (cytidine1402-2'-O)-methyltransferase
MSTLYLVSTPIGNLEDIGARALRILSEVPLIAAEDTRHTRKLLSHFNINTPLTSYYDHNKEEKLDRILESLKIGDVALVSNAGTPGLNDPGFLLVRAAVDAGHTISPIPGPSAPIAALVTSGLPTDKFLFLGYLPRKTNDRRKTISSVAEMPYTLIFFETPHRLLASLEDLLELLKDRQIALACELTKMFEEIFRGSLSMAIDHYSNQPLRGEFTLVVSGKIEGNKQWSQSQVRETLKARLLLAEPPSVIAREVSIKSNWPRRKVYNLLTEIQKDKPG